MQIDEIRANRETIELMTEEDRKAADSNWERFIETIIMEGLSDDK